MSREALHRGAEAATQISVMIVDSHGRHHSGFLTRHAAGFVAAAVLDAAAKPEDPR